jgi:hypothetical protein
MNENCAVSQQLESQANALREQQQVQNEFMNNVRILQSELTLLRQESGSISEDMLNSKARLRGKASRGVGNRQKGPHPSCRKRRSGGQQMRT